MFQSTLTRRYKVKVKVKEKENSRVDEFRFMRTDIVEHRIVITTIFM